MFSGYIGCLFNVILYHRFYPIRFPSCQSLGFCNNRNLFLFGRRFHEFHYQGLTKEYFLFWLSRRRSYILPSDWSLPLEWQDVNTLTNLRCRLNAKGLTVKSDRSTVKLPMTENGRCFTQVEMTNFRFKRADAALTSLK